MKNFGWSKLELKGDRVYMGPAEEVKVGGKPFIRIEAIGYDGKLHPSLFATDEVLAIHSTTEKAARSLYAIQDWCILDIKKVVSSAFKITEEELESDARNDRAVSARWCAFHIAREMGFRLQDIAAAFNRDHTTVIYGLSAAIERVKSDKDFKATLNMIKEVFADISEAVASHNKALPPEVEPQHAE